VPFVVRCVTVVISGHRGDLGWLRKFTTHRTVTTDVFRSSKIRMATGFASVAVGVVAERASAATHAHSTAREHFMVNVA